MKKLEFKALSGKLTFYKHFPRYFENWTFLKCPFFKSKVISFSDFSLFLFL